jgi:hypothetical protein
MNLLIYAFWSLAGIALAILFLKSIQGSIGLIRLDNQKSSARLILLSTILRWIVIFIAFWLALSHSFLSLLLIFVSFSLTRLLLLYWYQNRLSAKADRAL